MKSKKCFKCGKTESLFVHYIHHRDENVSEAFHCINCKINLSQCGWCSHYFENTAALIEHGNEFICKNCLIYLIADGLKAYLLLNKKKFTIQELYKIKTKLHTFNIDELSCPFCRFELFENLGCAD